MGNVLYLVNGAPFAFSSDEPLNHEQAAELQRKFEAQNLGAVVVLPAGTEVRHLDASAPPVVPLDFGQQTLLSTEPGWPNGLVAFVGFCGVLVGLAVGLLA